VPKVKSPPRSSAAGSCLRAFSQAACAWNHVTNLEGVIPGKLTA